MRKINMLTQTWSKLVNIIAMLPVFQTHTHTHILVYTFERGPSLFFFVISFFTPNRGHTPENIYGNRGLDRYTRTCM